MIDEKSAARRAPDILAAGPPEREAVSALREAAVRVAEELAPEDAGAVRDALLFLTRIVEGERGAMAAAPPAVGPDRLSTLLERLQTEVLDSLAGPLPAPSGFEVLRLWEGFERARALVRPQPPFAAGGIASTQVLSELVVELAHDIRSPLSSILFLSDTLRSGQSGEVNDLQHRQLGIMYGAALGLVSMVSDVVEITRGGDRLMDRSPSPFSIAEILNSLFSLVRPMAEERGVDLRILPPPLDVRLGYPVALSRVLLNLTTNAFKFTEAGFVEITVRTLEANLLEFSVRDTGGGLDHDTAEHLFNPFRPNSSGSGYGFSASGLGLAICRRLVRAMGSELHLETAPGWGTRFYYQLDLPPAGAP